MNGEYDWWFKVGVGFIMWMILCVAVAALTSRGGRNER